MFFICCRWTSPDELYGITKNFVNVRSGGRSGGLYEPIDIREVSTFDLHKKKYHAAGFFRFSPLTINVMLLLCFPSVKIYASYKETFPSSRMLEVWVFSLHVVRCFLDEYNIF
jgi:hypothetical protein